MKRLVIIPIAAFRNSDAQQNTEMTEKMVDLAEQLKARYERYLAKGQAKASTTFEEVYVLCSESPTAQKTAEIMERVLGIQISFHQELCSTDGHGIKLRNLHELVASQRSDILVMITDHHYSFNYPAYFSIMHKYAKPLDHVDIVPGEALIINNEKNDSRYQTSEKIIAKTAVLSEQ